jgi:threonine dehydratase
MGDSLVSLDDIRAAAARIRPLARVTPIVEVTDTAGDAAPGRPLSLKCENLQRSGAFKIRGAANMLLQLTAEDRRRGVITFSSGNHGIAMSLAAGLLGIPAVVVMRGDWAPRSSSRERPRSSARPGPRPRLPPAG